MQGIESVAEPQPAQLTDEEVVRRVRSGQTELYEILMRRHNRRLFRVARSILRNDADAETVMEDAYVNAYLHLDQFEERSRFSTWVTRITIHEAFAVLRRRKRFVELDDVMEIDAESGNMATSSRAPDPEKGVLEQEMKAVLENAIDGLPEIYRAVFVMRDVEGLDTAETAACLGITEESAKVRLHRARARMRKQLYARSGNAIQEIFAFHLLRCDRVVTAVLERIRNLKRSVS